MNKGKALLLLDADFFCCVGVFFFSFSLGGIFDFLYLLQAEECKNLLCYIRIEPQISYSRLNF